MNLLELCLSPDFGGLEIFFRDYAIWLSSQPSISVSLCVCSNTRIAGELAPRGLPTLDFASRTGALPVGAARKLAHCIDEQEIDAVHLHWKNDLPLCALAKTFARRKVRLIHTRHMDLPGPKHDPYHLYLYRSIDVYHTITKNLSLQARENLPIQRERIKQVYLGATVDSGVAALSKAELRSRFGLGDQFTVGVVGRISEYKAQHLLIDALWLLRDRGVVVHGVIAGHAMEPDYLESLKQRVVEAELSGQITFLGFQESPHALIRALDALVLTTVKETFGMVLIEAMLLGVPVIGSDAGGVPEIIQDGRSGLLFESENSSELALAVEKLYRDPEFTAGLADAGRARARSEFDRDTQFAKLLQLLRV